LDTKSRNNHQGTKANALLCPTCCVEYVEVQFDLEVDGVVLHDVKALRCPACEQELFTPEQTQTINKRVGDASNP
jgi:hypothetical protein